MLPPNIKESVSEEIPVIRPGHTVSAQIRQNLNMSHCAVAPVLRRGRGGGGAALMSEGQRTGIRHVPQEQTHCMIFPGNIRLGLTFAVGCL